MTEQSQSTQETYNKVPSTDDIPLNGNANSENYSSSSNSLTDAAAEPQAIKAPARNDNSNINNDKFVDLERNRTHEDDDEPYESELHRVESQSQASRHLSRAMTGSQLTAEEINANAKTPMPPMGLNKEIPTSFPDPEPYTVSFNGPDDPLHPHNWPLKRKIAMCALIGFNTAAVAWGSSIYSSAILFVCEEFGVGQVVGTLGTSLYVLGFATGPVVWAPLSELFGRRPILIISCLGFTLFQFAVATAKDFQTIMLGRAFGGIIGAAPLVVVPASFADLFDNRSRGKAITIFSMMVFCMPIIAPVAGSFICYSYLGWRWVEYITGIMGGAGLLFIVLFYQETHHPIILVNKAKEIKKRTGNWLIHAPHDEFELNLKDIVENNLSRPLKMLVREPILFLISFYNAFIYGILYLLLSAYPIVFKEGYEMQGGVAELPYLGLALGMFFGGSYCYFAEHFYIKAITKNGGKPVPEARLYPLFAGAIAFPVGLFWFTWCGNYPDKVHWMAPTAAGVFIGFGLLTIFNPSINYIIDTYLVLAASALAANTFLRSSAACAFPLFATQMFEGMGVNWAGLLLACIGFVLVPVPFLFFVYGKRIRSKSKYAFVI